MLAGRNSYSPLLKRKQQVTQSLRSAKQHYARVKCEQILVSRDTGLSRRHGRPSHVARIGADVARLVMQQLEHLTVQQHKYIVFKL